MDKRLQILVIVVRRRLCCVCHRVVDNGVVEVLRAVEILVDVVDLRIETRALFVCVANLPKPLPE